MSTLMGLGWGKGSNLMSDPEGMLLWPTNAHDYGGVVLQEIDGAVWAYNDISLKQVKNPWAANRDELKIGG